MARIDKLVLLGLLAASPAAAQTGQSCKSPQHRQFDFWVGTWDVSPTGQDKVVARSRAPIQRNAHGSQQVALKPVHCQKTQFLGGFIIFKNG